jgi:hypothetical protein
VFLTYSDCRSHSASTSHSHSSARASVIICFIAYFIFTLLLVVITGDNGLTELLPLDHVISSASRSLHTLHIEYSHLGLASLQLPTLQHLRTLSLISCSYQNSIGHLTSISGLAALRTLKLSEPVNEYELATICSLTTLEYLVIDPVSPVLK